MSTMSTLLLAAKIGRAVTSAGVRFKSQMVPTEDRNFRNTLVGRMVAYLNEASAKPMDADEERKQGTMDRPRSQHSDLFAALEARLRAAPGLLPTSPMYEAAMLQLAADLPTLTRAETLKFAFYLGLAKKTRHPGHGRLFKRALAQLHTAPTNAQEACILCSAAFKLAVRFRPPHFLARVAEIIGENLRLLRDPALFVTLIKAIRLNRAQDEELLATVACALVFNRVLDGYPFTAVCHVLALYADYAYYDEALLTALFGVAFKQLAHEKLEKGSKRHPAEHVRPKDLTRLLWGMSNLCYEADRGILEDVVVTAVEARVRIGEYRGDNVGLLVENLLYLWMMKHRTTRVVDLIKSTLVAENVARVHRLESSSKRRLNILLNLLQLEAPRLYSALGVKPLMNPKHNMEAQLARRPDLRRVFGALSRLTCERFEVRFRYTYEVPHLNLLGITGYAKGAYKAVFVEVLDDFTALKNRPCAYGPMKSKLGVLGAMDEALITVESSDIDEMTEQELETYLQEELNLSI